MKRGIKMSKNNELGYNDDGSDIAKKLGITRQAVSNTLKRAMRKFYMGVKEMNPEFGPFEAATQMMKMFEVSDDEDVNKFFRLFPREIREEIRIDVMQQRRK
jgi:predicted DNA-binding protein YlxM (UPF0122 family)